MEFNWIERDLIGFSGIWWDLMGFSWIECDLMGFDGIWRDLKGFSDEFHGI